ncbi:homoserine O-acetyltransferase [Robiginitalea myxolifaciens]|uniref:Homoserine O-acetyltransferase n=1 Tax=Robiginitalea myxolifaciens TaxID=400055 RepID=A0A1I6FS73_9FLAO|nr:bifunctional aspartate kinase/homoserine dehydrogenase I [Robiginitalea myxolifaciens]SFR32647.1 homoserine O-acetyltransferase [Robiginitalea myxolifaciens]
MDLPEIAIPGFTTRSGAQLDIRLSYEQFGQKLGEAPVVLINHALTGNSHVGGPDGWWNALVGLDKCIDIERYTVLCFNVPGNGYDGFLIENYKDFVAGDIARIFWQGLDALGVDRLFALLGGSLGGGIAWEMAALQPERIAHLIPVASDWKSTDWLIANCQIQEQFLVNSSQPVHDARMHAMLCYRTPESFKRRFGRSTNEDLQVFNVESWLLHHGKKLQQRFQLAAYKLTNQLLKTIDITRNGEEVFQQLRKSPMKIHIIGVDSDLFFTAVENKETYKQLAQSNAGVTYGEIQSVHGHDAFLIEFEQMEELLAPIFKPEAQAKAPLVLKFGGKSLANGNGLDRVVEIIRDQAAHNQKVLVVLSARGKATDQLENLLERAATGKDYHQDLEEFVQYQQHAGSTALLNGYIEELGRLLEGVQILGDYSPKIRAQVLAIGELLSVAWVSERLQASGLNAIAVDSREFLKTKGDFLDGQLLEGVSRENTADFFEKLPKGSLPLVTGFIASNERGETTTLGRNGSNYTAALLANFLNAAEMRNYTHVDGIYTANPDLVPEARRIDRLSYEEANELANFGATILHAKTIVPLLEKNIPLRILNTFNSDNEGTLIGPASGGEGIRSLSVIEDQALINLEGRGLLGKVGVDAKIFRALGQSGISVGIISQGSSERGIGLVVAASEATRARDALIAAFEEDFKTRDIQGITIRSEVAVISIVGLELSNFHKPYSALIRNQVVPLLFNNTVSGRNVSLVVRKPDLLKAVNVIHGQIFGILKKINLAVFGVGTVGGTLMQQILESREKIEARKGIAIHVFAVANSRQVLLDHRGINSDWETKLKAANQGYRLEDIFDYARAHHLENLIAVDNTASLRFVERYTDLVANGFDLVSSNKIANTLSFDFYTSLREQLQQHQKQYLYETNVGAGLPLIDTIALLHLSGENITRIRGVFSGSLSYIFNSYCQEDRPFSEIVQEALDRGYTEPDPREDLSGNDVGRKLLILARELDLENEFEDIAIENLIPQDMQELELPDFIAALPQLDAIFQERKKTCGSDEVLRYVGELSGDLLQQKGDLKVRLECIPQNDPLGQVRGADSLIEIFTESYGEKPLVIQGAGAGAAVTARGVFGDILRIAEQGLRD